MSDPSWPPPVPLLGHARLRKPVEEFYRLSVAFVGLGRMGSGIARNIQASGFRLTVYNRTTEKMKPLSKQVLQLRALPESRCGW